MEFKLKESMYFGDRLVKKGSIIKVARIPNFKEDPSAVNERFSYWALQPFEDGSGPFTVHETTFGIGVGLNDWSDDGEEYYLKPEVEVFTGEHGDSLYKNYCKSKSEANRIALRTYKALDRLQTEYTLTCREAEMSLSHVSLEEYYNEVHDLLISMGFRKI